MNDTKNINDKIKMFVICMYNDNIYTDEVYCERTENISWSQVRLTLFWKVPALPIRCCYRGKQMLSLLLLTCRRGITWTSLRVHLGWLKCMGTDSSMLFLIPRLCFPKHSVNVRRIWLMYQQGRVGFFLMQRL